MYGEYQIHNSIYLGRALFIVTCCVINVS